MKYYRYQNFFLRSLDKEKGYTLLGSLVVLGLFFYFGNRVTFGELTYWFLWICAAIIAVAIAVYAYSSFKNASKKKYIQFLVWEKSGLMQINIDYTDNIIELLKQMQSISNIDQRRKINFIEVCNYLDLLNIAEDKFEEAKALLIQEQKYELIKDLEELRKYSSKRDNVVSIHDEIEANADAILAVAPEILGLIEEVRQRRKEVVAQIDWLTKELERLNW